MLRADDLRESALPRKQSSETAAQHVAMGHIQTSGKQKPRHIGRGFVHRDACAIQNAASTFPFRSHQPRRPPPAKIRPGRPAPTVGPGTPLTYDHVPGTSELKLI